MGLSYPPSSSHLLLSSRRSLNGILSSSFLPCVITTHLRTNRFYSSNRQITMMPEGPEVRTLVDQLQPSVGRRLVDIRFLSGRYVRHDLPKGFLDFRDTMKLSYDPGLGKTDVVKEWNAKGKFIYLILESEGHEPKKQIMRAMIKIFLMITFDLYGSLLVCQDGSS